MLNKKIWIFSNHKWTILNELLYLRYRLASDDINKMSENELKSIILNRDEKLLHKQIFANYTNNSLVKETSKENNLTTIEEKKILN